MDDSRLPKDYKDDAAWADWRRLCLDAEIKGYGYLAGGLQPPPGAGWREVDEAIRALKKGMASLHTLLHGL